MAAALPAHALWRAAAVAQALKRGGPRGLLKLLQGKTTLVLGPSGAGKSTLINLLAPGALAQTGEISQALNSGKHTTTSTTWYWVDRGPKTTALDRFTRLSGVWPEPHRPGAAGGLHARPQTPRGALQVLQLHHLHEPGCGVMAAVQTEKSTQPS
jgi:ribosome biogenesis GTPase